MPDYYDANGRKVTEAEACIAGTKRLRDGFKSMMREGEWIGFEASFMDSKPSTASVFLTDAKADGEVQRLVDEMRTAHDRNHSFLGDRAPAFDVAAATLIARAQVDNGHAAVRDAVRDASFR